MDKLVARSDLLVDLIEAASRFDSERLRRIVNAMIAEERAKQHHVLADRLEEAARANGSSPPERSPVAGAGRQVAIAEVEPQVALSDLVLPESVKQVCHQVVEEQNRADLLRAHNLEPRHRILLAGPPGNGKTSLAIALARDLMMPLFVVRYEALIASFLGETGANLRRLFEYVLVRRCTLFFDEFDAIAKERGDIHETGEVKRVVSSLLLQIDSLPSYVVVVVATNHPELLDRAAWRRFQIRLELSSPTLTQRARWFEQFERRTDFSLVLSPRTLAQQFPKASYSDLRDFAENVLRRSILSLGEVSPKQAVEEELVHWRNRYSLKPKR